MLTTLFVFPIKPGKLDQYKNFIKKCATERRKEYQDLLKRYSLNTIKLWHHQIDGKDHAIFIHDMSDEATEKLKHWSSSTHPFDMWFNKNLMDCYEITPGDMEKRPELLCAITTQD